MRSEWSIALVFFAALAGPLARAGSMADELAQIESEHVLLKAKLRVLETRAQMAARQGDIERLTPAGQRTKVPTVDGVEGLAGKLRATLTLDNGQQAEVRQGDALPNGMRVVSIQSDGVVVLTTARKRVRLKPTEEAAVRNLSPIGAADYLAPRQERMPILPPMPQTSTAVPASATPMAGTPPAPANRMGAGW